MRGGGGRSWSGLWDDSQLSLSPATREQTPPRAEEKKEEADCLLCRRRGNQGQVSYVPPPRSGGQRHFPPEIKTVVWVELKVFRDKQEVVNSTDIIILPRLSVFCFTNMLFLLPYGV